MTFPIKTKQNSGYVELQVTSNFSFLRGASHPDELILTAASLGYSAIAITDHNTLAGVVRAHTAAKQVGIRLIIGTRIDLGLENSENPYLSFLCFPQDRNAYGRLSRLLTIGRLRAPKGKCWLVLEDVLEHDAGMLFIILPPDFLDSSFINLTEMLSSRWIGRCFLGANFLYLGDDRDQLFYLAQKIRIPLVATNDVQYHIPDRHILQDIITCIREGCTLQTAGWRLAANAERYLKAPDEMYRLFSNYPEAVAQTIEIANRCQFDLDELSYEYPIDSVDGRKSPQQKLEQLAWSGARERYSEEIPDKVYKTLNHELSLIKALNFASYFLTVYDLVSFARSRDILCQGRGSAANSVVCYCLGITAIDPNKIDLLFERFISVERNEPPDIDVDFEHERREEVIQYVYEKYGHERAGLAATVVTYKAKSAIREVGKVFGLSNDILSSLANNIWGWTSEHLDADRVREIGLDPNNPYIDAVLRYARELLGFPRHLSQHVGGFVITNTPLCDLVPIQNATMENRTVIEWDKNDLDVLGILKIDLLSLGMLTCIRKCFDLIASHYGQYYDLTNIPAEDSAVYDMLSKADAIGVFQVESRAQMAMLPRLSPRNFYDLVIQVAIVRPGPIQGDMVHPYLRRRIGKECVEFPSAELERVLGKTLGVPLFQEQAMRIAIIAAGFTPSEADSLRRSMATFRNNGAIHYFRKKMINGMVKRGYDNDFAERCFQQIEGFGNYGFPESHAASFALIVYISAWLKCHYPVVFTCALLNSQPMGFYAPAQIIRDVREHGIEVRQPDINHSLWDSILEPVSVFDDSLTLPIMIEKIRFQSNEAKSFFYSLRLGLRQIKNLLKTDVKELLDNRGLGYSDPEDVWRRTSVSKHFLENLSNADSWRSCKLDRRQALWKVKALPETKLPLFAYPQLRIETSTVSRNSELILPDMSINEHVVEDYLSLRLSLKAHPLQLLRQQLNYCDLLLNKTLNKTPIGSKVTVGGLIIVRQRPSTARGVVFLTLEDESGIANVVIRPSVFSKYRRIILSARMIAVTGKIERDESVVHLIAEYIFDFSLLLENFIHGVEEKNSQIKVFGNEKNKINLHRINNKHLLYKQRIFR